MVEVGFCKKTRINDDALRGDNEAEGSADAGSADGAYFEGDDEDLGT